MSGSPWSNKLKDGLSSIGSLRGEVDRVVEAFTKAAWGAANEQCFGRPWTPHIDIVDNNDEVIVRAEVAGVDPNDLEITVTGHRLTLAGEKKDTVEKHSGDFYLTETRYGTFSRSIELPSSVDTDQVSAEHAHGVVKITLKKAVSSATRRVPVKTDSTVVVDAPPAPPTS